MYYLSFGFENTPDDCYHFDVFIFCWWNLEIEGIETSEVVVSDVDINPDCDC